MRLLTKQYKELKNMKHERKIIGKWFLISIFINLITILHIHNINLLEKGLNHWQSIYTIIMVLSLIYSFQCLVDVNIHIKRLQKYL